MGQRFSPCARGLSEDGFLLALLESADCEGSLAVERDMLVFEGQMEVLSIRLLSVDETGE